jgi:hypothetical protein
MGGRGGDLETAVEGCIGEVEAGFWCIGGEVRSIVVY